MSCPLSALVLPIATVVEHSGRSTPSVSRPFPIYFHQLFSKPLLLRLASVVDHCGRPSIEHMYVVCIMKRYFSGVARRL